MTPLLIAIAILLASGLIAFTLQRMPWSTWIGAAGVCAASLLGVIPAARAFIGGTATVMAFSWGSFGTLHLGLDALTGFFLLPILGLSALTAVYGNEYLASFRGRKNLGAAILHFNTLVASMMLVVMARDALSFLIAWEIMALSSFFLVTLEGEKESVRSAGWIYLVASHLGTAFVFGFFLLLAGKAGALDFASLQTAASALPAMGGLLFVFAVIGFGAKAGFLPLHVWLPEAHPAAPSHVSALMSGVMIKTGIYGLLRALTLLGPPTAWWGWVLVAIGLTSGVLGMLFALAQHDFKRLLAYSSVENIGIITLGIGLGVIGIAHQIPVLAVLGFAGGLLHVTNHAIFKGLLFLGAGAVLHATHTRELDHLGGLAKKMPWTAAGFLTGAVAIVGLPPLNGFVSELLIYLAAFAGSTSGAAELMVPALAVIIGLALIGGLAAACFTKAFGTVFLGSARTAHVESARDPGLAMRIPMAVLSLLCIAIGLFAPFLVDKLSAVVALFPGQDAASVATQLSWAGNLFGGVLLVTATFGVLLATLAYARARLLANRAVREAVTWDCGYTRPASTMQYTSASFADPIVRLFHNLLATRRSVQRPEGYFPTGAAIVTKTPDRFTTEVFAPAFTTMARGLAWFRWLQHGGVHLYVLYVALTLIVLLITTLK